MPQVYVQARRQFRPPSWPKFTQFARVPNDSLCHNAFLMVGYRISYAARYYSLMHYDKREWVLCHMDGCKLVGKEYKVSYAARYLSLMHYRRRRLRHLSYGGVQGQLRCSLFPYALSQAQVTSLPLWWGTRSTTLLTITPLCLHRWNLRSWIP